MSNHLKYIDIGANLQHKSFENIQNILIDAKNKGVERIIITGTDIKKSEAAIKICRNYNHIMPLYCTMGVHPHNVNKLNENDIKKLKELILSNKDIVVAVGECGLDYDRMFSTKDNQKKWFDSQIKLAIELNLPLFLHEREASMDFRNILDNYRGEVKGVVHCFTGDSSTLLEYVNFGFFIGITGWICDDRRNSNLLEALQCLPLDNLLIETDCPYLSPIPKKDRNNKPEYLPYVLDRLCEELELDPEYLSQTVYENTIKLFNLPKIDSNKDKNELDSNQTVNNLLNPDDVPKKVPSFLEVLMGRADI